MLIVGNLMLHTGLLLFRPIPLIAIINPAHNIGPKVTESLCSYGDDFNLRDYDNPEVDVTESISLCLDDDDFNLSCVNSIATQNTKT
jgi:hypothetical protein